MKEVIIKAVSAWEYTEDPYEIEQMVSEKPIEFDDVAYIPITDRGKPQACVIRKGDRYGVFTLDHTNGMGGPGTWLSPTIEPFPYDEVKCCSFPFDYPNEYGLFAFRVVDKWGIIKVVDCDSPSHEVYDAEYGLSKRQIVVPCEYASLAEAESQLSDKFEWVNPFEVNDVFYVYHNSCGQE